jgi:general secretion pathway protein A
VSKQELIDTLSEFLLSLLPLGAGALLIIDEAQNLPLQVLEQIRILSNLETDKEKLLQIVLVGQLNLQELLKSPGLRQLDQRISIRYELKPLNREETAAYISHRLTIAGGGAVVSFAPKALDLVHRYTSGIPRLINLLCDRSLLGGYSARVARITPEIVSAAATSLELTAPRRPAAVWLQRRMGSFAAGAAVVAALAGVTYAGVMLQEPSASADSPGRQNVEAAAPAATASAPAETRTVPPPAPAQDPRQATDSARPAGPGSSGAKAAGTSGATEQITPRASKYSIIVGSFRHPVEAERLMTELQAQGYRVRSSRVEGGARGVWHQVLAGPYTDLNEARQIEARIRQLPGYADAQLVPR